MKWIDKKIILIFSIALLGIGTKLHALLDLDDLANEFILESKQIKIPGYPHAFNPSIIRWNDSYLMSFRIIPDPKFSFNSRLGLIRLDRNFSPIGNPQILDTQHEDPYPISTHPSRAEDARLLMINDRLYMVYSDNKDFAVTRGGFRVYISELRFNGSAFIVHNNECVSHFPGASLQKREKNWTPFDYKGNLLLTYSLSPHKIFKPLIGQGKCETFCSTSGDIDWKWGELRGGSPGLLHGDEYFAFFHSSISMPTVQSQGRHIPHYFMGAYTFSSEPPFQITSISAAPIIGTGYYSGAEYKPYWGSVKAIFPCGYIYDDNFVWIAYGKQDHEIWIAQLDKDALFNSLTPVRTKVDSRQNKIVD